MKEKILHWMMHQLPKLFGSHNYIVVYLTDEDMLNGCSCFESEEDMLTVISGIASEHYSEESQEWRNVTGKNARKEGEFLA